MIFEDWMRYKGLSESSILKYEGAVNGALSKWAIEADLLQGPLISLKSHRQFELVASEIRKLDIFLERNERGHGMYNAALNKYAEYLAEGYDNDTEEDIEVILSNVSINSTEKASLINSRIGQEKFRQKLVSYWKCCAVTGFSDVNFLIASHIKPWRESSNLERLDVYNGILLLPNIDKAFDDGYITFEKDGNIKISPQFLDPEKLGIYSTQKIHLSEKHNLYMEFHRVRVYRP